MSVIKRLLWLLVDMWHVQWSEPDLYIDLRRVNDEERAMRRMGLEDDIEYRARVCKRMTEGLTSAQMKPLYVRPDKTRRRRRPLGNLAQFPQVAK